MTPSPCLPARAIARLDAAARLILRDPELARDAVQEGFIRAWRSLPTLRDPDRFEAWLHRLVFHACMDATRRRRRRPMEVELTPLDNPVGRRHGVAHRRSRPPRWRAPAAPAGVARRHRPALLPRDGTCRTVAAALEIPVGTAKSRHHRALGEMRAAHHRGRPRPRHRTARAGRAVRMNAATRPSASASGCRSSSRSSARRASPTTTTTCSGRPRPRRQRPSWASLERWLPMGVVARPAPFGLPSWRPDPPVPRLVLARPRP